MRKMMLASLVALIAATFFYVGCKRENSQEKVNDVSKQKIIAKVDAWLEGQKNVLDQKGNERIKALTKNLDFTNLRTELISDEEQFIIIPIKDNFKPVNTRNIVVVNNLVLVITKEETFSKGNIVQYQPASEQHDIDVLSRNIFNIYTGKKVLRSGEFAFFTVFGKPLYKLNYKNGTMNAHSVAEPKKATPAANGPDPDPISPAPICTDWYWVTTYFYEDGHTETTSTFAFTTCESTSGGGGSVECCIPDQNIVLTSTSISEVLTVLRVNPSKPVPIVGISVPIRYYGTLGSILATNRQILKKKPVFGSLKQ
jgi:hypothetical protein